MPPLPISDICEGDKVTVTFSCAVIPYILGLLEIYRYKDSFTGTDEQKYISVGVIHQLREVLAMACCGDESLTRIIQHRLNPTTGEPEISIDDGATWTPDPESVYSNAVVLPPLSGDNGNSKRCQAANDVVGKLKDIQGSYSRIIGGIDSLEDLMITLIVEIVTVLLLGWVAAAIAAAAVALIPKVLEIARELLGISQAAYDAIFTEEVWNDTRCIIYCHCPASGVFSTSDWIDIQTDLKLQLGIEYRAAGKNIAAMVNVMGVVGLNNAARMLSGSPGNCDDCDCGCGEGCDITYTAYQYNDPAWTVHGEYTRWNSHIPVGTFDSFTLEGTNAVLQLANSECIRWVSCVVNNGCPGTGAQIELFIDGVSRGVRTPLDKAPFDPSGCLDPSAAWEFPNGYDGDTLTFSQVSAPCSGGYDNLLICARVGVCV